METGDIYAYVHHVHTLVVQIIQQVYASVLNLGLCRVKVVADLQPTPLAWLWIDAATADRILHAVVPAQVACAGNGSGNYPLTFWASGLFASGALFFSGQ